MQADPFDLLRLSAKALSHISAPVLAPFTSDMQPCSSLKVSLYSYLWLMALLSHHQQLTEARKLQDVVHLQLSAQLGTKVNRNRPLGAKNDGCSSSHGKVQSGTSVQPCISYYSSSHNASAINRPVKQWAIMGKLLAGQHRRCDGSRRSACSDSHFQD